MKLELGDIQETVFYSSGDADVDYEILQQDETDLVDFCIDVKGRVRRGVGICSVGPHEDDNLDYVPSVKYSIEHSAWNSHSQYVVMDLPNPVGEPRLFYVIRTAMIAEFSLRLKRQIKNAKARLKRKPA